MLRRRGGFHFNTDADVDVDVDVEVLFTVCVDVDGGRSRSAEQRAALVAADTGDEQQRSFLESAPGISDPNRSPSDYTDTQRPDSLEERSKGARTDQ